MAMDRLPRNLGLFGVLLAALAIARISGVASTAPIAQAPGMPALGVTFAKDIAPILQRSCQECHHADGVAPMALVTYEDVRPWAKSIKMRTALRSQRGAMPPFFVEKNIGIQKFKHDPSLSDAEVAMVATWVDSGAPRGNPADMPKPLEFDGTDKWTIGEADLILKSKDVTVPAIGPDHWGDFGMIPTGLTEDRYVSAVEVREVNDIPHDKSATTVGGRYVFHHMTYESVVEGERASSGANEGGGSWPIHEVGRNA
ncbi:MAG TPA: cytochrome c, partial [Vicinamibacterales bacterium]|nr:cytochrome c [Vicinamibacterales bacterium]